MALLAPPPGIRVFTVGELTREVKSLLEDSYPDLWVEGEVSNLARPPSGHLYLTLKDQDSPLRAVIYRGVALRMRFDLRDGLRVLVRGRLSLYAPRGDYQFLVEDILPKGIGPLELAFRQLKEKLSLLGYFEAGRKKPLPLIPGRIGLVSSPTGSAVRDVLEVLARRWPAAEVLLIPVRVQGNGAADEISAALETFSCLALQYRPDVVLIARGGGSLEDLWAFNEESVAHAIFRSRIPVITGIGHEDDLTIADLVSDRRALTPTEAAERAVPDRSELARKLEAHGTRLNHLLVRTARVARKRLEELNARLGRAVQQRAFEARNRMVSAAARLEGVNPLNVLSRGYSLTATEDGNLLRDAENVLVGQRIVTRLTRGEVVSIVERARL